MIARRPVSEILSRVLPDADDAARDRARAALDTLEASGVPWYLRLLTGMGAWAGGGFMLSFIMAIVAAILGVNNFEGFAIILGLAALGAAVMLRRSVSGTNVGAQFLRQLALVGCFCGQMLFIGGVGSTTSSTETAAVAALIVSAVLIFAYPDRVQRFCSTLIIAGALWSLGYATNLPYVTDTLALLLTAATLFVGRVMLRGVAGDSGENARGEIAEPVMYGCAIALFAVLIAGTTVTMFVGPQSGIRELRMLLISAPTVFGFVLGLLWLTASIFGEHDARPAAPEAVLAFVAIIGIGWITRSTPAITATLLMLMLGFDRRARALIALSIVFFLMFGTAFYYGLNLTLLQKSGILAASGAFCLLACAFVRFRYPVRPLQQENA